MPLKSYQIPPMKDREALAKFLQDFNAAISTNYICSVELGTEGDDKGKNLIIVDDGKAESLIPTVRDFPKTLTEQEIAGRIAAIEDSENFAGRNYGNVLLGTQETWVALFDPVPAKPQGTTGAMTFLKTKAKVANRGVPPDLFLRELVEWARKAPDEIFADNTTAANDVYPSFKDRLGPYRDIIHRRACMLEIMRVLAGFESSWNWREGIDKSKAEALKKNPKATEAGAWQVSADSLNWGKDLKKLVADKVGTTLDPELFQEAMKTNHTLAMEYIARLLRHTILANGPLARHEVDTFLSPDAVKEFQQLLTA